MALGTAHNGQVSIAYEVVQERGQPLLLVMGMGPSMISWPRGFIESLIGAGFAVARFDNRDSGLSTHFSASRPPGALAALVRKSRAPYRLEAMADDAVAVLDSVGWAQAHVVGISLGAAIGQVMAVRHARRVRTLTSIGTAPVNLRQSRVPFATIRFLGAVARQGRPADRSEAEDRGVAMARFLSPQDAIDEALVRQTAGDDYERSYDPDGTRRQGAALATSWSRIRTLEAIRVPTLVVHGDADPLASPKGSRVAARLIPGARLMIIPGMGHDLPARVWSTITDAIVELAGHDRPDPA